MNRSAEVHMSDARAAEERSSLCCAGAPGVVLWVLALAVFSLLLFDVGYPSRFAIVFLSTLAAIVLALLCVGFSLMAMAHSLPLERRLVAVAINLSSILAFGVSILFFGFGHRLG